MKKVNYEVKGMKEWNDVNADLVITDPPFGINFNGKEGNYNRDEDNVVDGYVEWEKNGYTEKISNLLDVIYRNTTDKANALIFSGWNNSPKVHKACISHNDLTLEGKMYWNYNFAPYCSRRPAHNVYEIYWVRNSDDWYYNNECSYKHCENGEANLSAIDVKRNYLKEMPKYPTRLPTKIVKVLLEHYSEENDLIFDPLAGSGSVGISANQINRKAVMGDKNKEAKDVFETTVENMD
jgi:site-specific DNA-methyltransferase (adenine-specific)